MSHLTDEQLEDVLQGTQPQPEHVSSCDTCQARLAEARAVRGRLQSTFGSLKAGDDLRARLQAAVQQNAASPSATRPTLLRLHRRLFSGLAAAAVVAVAFVLIQIFSDTQKPVLANQLALSGIHHLSLDHPAEFFRHDDPNQMAAYLETKVGHRPHMVPTRAGMVICGCRACTFDGRPVPTYMVDSPQGRVSIVVLTQSPEQLGMETTADHHAWTATCRCCRMAAVRRGDLTYYAVGDEASHAELVEILEQL